MNNNNITLEDILAEEDPIEVTPSQNMTLEDILAEDSDKVTEKILHELKQKTATSNVNNLANNINQNLVSTPGPMEGTQTTSMCKNTRVIIITFKKKKLILIHRWLII